MGEKKRTPFQERGQVLGGFLGREQVRPLCAELPLAAFRDVFVLGPLTDGPPPDSEKSGQFGVGRKSESFLDGCFGHHHGRKSRPLDLAPVKHSSPIGLYGSSRMDTLADRLRRALALRGMKPPQLIRATRMSKQGIYNILNGATKADKIREGTVSKICEVLGINQAWLQRGKGPIEGNDSRTEPDWSDVKGYAQAVGLGKGAEAQEYAETHSLKFRASSLAKKRLRPEGLAVMYGDGDSMEPRIRKGDAVLFDTSDRRPSDGCIFVIEWKGEIYAKRAEIIDDAVYFRADNPNGDHHWKKPKRMDAKRDPISILGRVRWIGSWED